MCIKANGWKIEWFGLWIWNNNQKDTEDGECSSLFWLWLSVIKFVKSHTEITS